MPEGDLLRQRADAMKLVQYKGVSKTPVEELPWSTGLLDVWKDPELLSMSMTGVPRAPVPLLGMATDLAADRQTPDLCDAAGGLCGVCCILYLPAKTFVDVQNGAGVWKRRIDPTLSAEDVGIKGAMGESSYRC